MPRMVRGPGLGTIRRLLSPWSEVGGRAGRNYWKLSGKKRIRKRLHRVVRWTFLVIVSLLFIVLVVIVLLLYPVVQTWIAGIVSRKLSEDLGITVRIERVEIRPLAMNRLHGVFIADLNGDTLIAVDELRIRGLRIDAEEQRIKVRRLELHDTRFALAKAQGDAHSNLTNLLERIASKDTSSSGADWKVQCGELDIRRLHFSFHDGNADTLPFGVDFHHVDVNTADIVGKEVRVAGDSILVDLEKISLRDRSGLVLDELSGGTKVSPRGIRIDGMRIRTPDSELVGDLKFETESFADFDEFETNVHMRVDLDSSRVEFADIALFAPDLQGIRFPIMVSGRFRGTVNELKARDMHLDLGERSHFGGNVDMSGLPDVANTFMVIDVDHFNTDARDLALLPVPPFMEQGHLAIPVEVERMGAMSFTGNFTGFPRSFTASGQAFCAAGPLSTDISYERDTVSNVFELRGGLATTGFDLGRVIGDPTVGDIGCDVIVKANGRSLATMTAEIEGTVPVLHVKQLNVGGIALKGRLEKNLFNGMLQCDDPHLRMDFDGLADLRGKWPKVNFSANVEHLDPRSFGLIGGEGYSALSMRIRAEGEFAPDSLKGSIRMQDVEYCEDSVDLELGDISLVSAREGGEPVLTLRSDAVDADVRGPFFPTRLPEAAQSVLFSVFPALQEQVRYDQEDQRFAFSATVKQAQPILDLVAKGLLIDSGAVVSGAFDSRSFDLNLNAMLPKIRFGALSGDSVDVILDKTMDVLAFRFRSARQSVGSGTFIDGIELTGKAYQDEVQLRAAWEGSNNGTAGDLDIDALVLNGHSAAIDLRPSTLYFGRGSWVNDRTAHILIDTTSIRIDSLELRNGQQRILLGGTICEDPRIPLRFDLRDLRLENARPFYDGPEVHGLINGDGKAYSLYKAPYLLSYLCVDSLAVNEDLIGDLRLSASWNNHENVIDLGGDLHRDTLRILGFSGVLAPGRKEELDVDLLLDHFDLGFIEPYLPEAISRVQGQVTGKIGVTGALAEPLANGEVMLEDAGIRINYLNTKYTFSHPLIIRPDQFVMDNVTLHDEQGGKAIARSFSLNHTAFSRWNFDVAADMDHLLVLNTTFDDNQLYYGTAKGSGELNVEGYTENLGITVDAHTEEGTSLHFPLGASNDVGGLTFVRFVKSGQNIDSLEAPVDLSGVHLDMKVAVTPEARFELIFDPTVGDIISGSGRGDIAMTVTPSGDFSMKGGLEILEGDYLFTLRNLVNKKFTVDPGGRITWYGDPFDARLDMNAVYKLRTALYDIMPPSERSEQYRKRVPVEVIMHLTDKLMQPEIGFDVRLPSVDEGVRTQVNTVLSDPDKLNRQVFALVVLNKFISDDASQTGVFGQDAGASATTTMAEFASSQFSNWLGQVSDDFDLGVNYRPGNSISSEELEVAVGTALFNNRVQLNTNVGVTGGTGTSSQNGTQFIGDFSVEYLITDDGKLRFKAYSVSNDRNLNQLNQAATTQGAGPAYREEFDTLGEFIRKIANLFRKQENRKPVE